MIKKVSDLPNDEHFYIASFNNLRLKGLFKCNNRTIDIKSNTAMFSIDTVVFSFNKYNDNLMHSLFDLDLNASDLIAFVMNSKEEAIDYYIELFEQYIHKKQREIDYLNRMLTNAKCL